MFELTLSEAENFNSESNLFHFLIIFPLFTQDKKKVESASLINSRNVISSITFLKGRFLIEQEWTAKLSQPMQNLD